MSSKNLEEILCSTEVGNLINHCTGEGQWEPFAVTRSVRISRPAPIICDWYHALNSLATSNEMSHATYIFYNCHSYHGFTAQNSELYLAIRIYYSVLGALLLVHVNTIDCSNAFDNPLGAHNFPASLLLQCVLPLYHNKAAACRSWNPEPSLFPLQSSAYCLLVHSKVPSVYVCCHIFCTKGIIV